MKEDTLLRFRREMNSFFVLVLLNMVFGALAMAFGMQFIIMSVLGQTGYLSSPAFRILAGAFSLVCFGLGLMWVTSSARMLKGVTGVRREYRNRNGPVSDEVLTGWIVRLTAHYRENKPRIRWMVLICALGGCAFLILGLANLVQGISGLTSSSDLLIQVLPFIAAAINLTIGGTSLLFTNSFRKYSAAWDLRLAEAAQSESTLKQAMEQR